MKVLRRMLLFLLCACAFCGTTAGYAEQGDADMSYRTEEIWCENGSSRIYGVAYIPEAEANLRIRDGIVLYLQYFGKRCLRW